MNTRHLFALLALLPFAAGAQLTDLDFTAPDADTLPGMAQKINANNDVIEADVAALEAADVTLDGRVDTAEADILTLEAADVSLDGRLDTAEATLLTLAAADVTLDGRLDTAETDITALEGADVALDARLDTAEADILALEGAALVYATGTATASWGDACSTTTTTNFNWTQIGNIVFVRFTEAFGSCTGDSTNFVTDNAPIPVAQRPASQQLANSDPLAVVDAGSADDFGCFRILTSGNIAVNRTAGGTFNCDVASWSASGTRRWTYINGAQGALFSYGLAP